ncbi:MAG TPA: THUMP domain-containing protein [bacterium]|nr:THUMP domain-containing protein [bacterium]HPG45994.1 THUMP domain-containing protein [bacterium]HPM97816.1 THUMP domain-containing protein [bacterium]
MDYDYQRKGRYFAQIAGGMEGLGAAEIEELGASETAEAYRGLYFSADRDALYRINYLTRLCTRILAPLTSFKCHSSKYLYRRAREIDWTAFLGAEHTFAVFASVANSAIRHSHYAALCLKDAVVDTFRDATGERPDVDTLDPDVWFNLYIDNNMATISIDTSGGSLHRRGYRSAAGAAPMQETLAAAIVRLSEWNGSRPLIDPMCGSGTLLCEALMACCRIPAGYLRRRWGFTALPDFEPQLWKTVREKANAEIREIPSGLLLGNDVDRDAVRQAKENLRRLPSGDRVEIQLGDYRQLAGFENHVILCNPPYGVRLQKDTDLGGFYRELGDFLKQHCKGSTAYIYFGERQWIPAVGLHPQWRKPLVNGALDGRLVKLDLY